LTSFTISLNLSSTGISESLETLDSGFFKLFFLLLENFETFLEEPLSFLSSLSSYLLSLIWFENSGRELSSFLTYSPYSNLRMNSEKLVTTFSLSSSGSSLKESFIVSALRAFLKFSS
jgi:hypothetical protein